MNPKKCDFFSKILIGSDVKNNTKFVAYARCKMWHCEYCAAKNKTIWRAATIHALNAHPLAFWQFWTFTAHERARRAANSLKNLQRGWSKLVDRARYWAKTNGLKMLYLYVVEPHKSGALHMHVIVGFEPIEINKGSLNQDAKEMKIKWLDTKWLKDTARVCGMGYQAKIKPILDQNPGFVAAYIVKYMTKLEKPLPKNTRRIQPSKGFIKTMGKNASEHSWSATDKLTITDALHYWSNNSTIIDVSNMLEVTTDDFDANGNYSGNRSDKT